MSRRRVIVWELEPEVTHANQDCGAYGEAVFWLLHWRTPEERELANEVLRKLKDRGFRGYGLNIFHMPEALDAYRALCTTHDIAPEAGR